MNRYVKSKSSLFFIELILSIFFFIIAMAVCLELFVKAHTLSRDTVAINQAVLYSQNLSELFLGSEGDYAAVKEKYISQDCIAVTSLDADTHLLLLFDKEWNAVTDMNSAYYLVLSTYNKDTDFAYEDTYVMRLLDLTDAAWQSDAAVLADESDALVHHLQVKYYTD